MALSDDLNNGELPWSMKTENLLLAELCMLLVKFCMSHHQAYLRAQ